MGNSVSKSAISNAIREATGSTVPQADAAAEAVLGAILEGVKADGRFNIIGFGSFALQERPARKGRNPRTGEEIDIPASRALKFSPSPTLKKSL